MNIFFFLIIFFVIFIKFNLDPDTDSGCRFYYVCYNQESPNPRAYRYACPSGRIFDVRRKGCFPSNTVQCSYRKDPREYSDSSTTTTTSISTTSLAISALCINGRISKLFAIFFHNFSFKVMGIMFVKEPTVNNIIIALLLTQSLKEFITILVKIILSLILI